MQRNSWRARHAADPDRQHGTKTRLVILMLLASCLNAAVAGDNCVALRVDEKILPGRFLPNGDSAWVSRALPSRGDLDAVLEELDYGNELPVFHAADLNGDGRKELLLTTHGGKLCGSAGCPYVLLSSGNLRKIGTFFGHLAFLDERINGYRIIQSYSRLDSVYTHLDTYVFDGNRYRQVAHAILEPCGLEYWFRRMRPGTGGTAFSPAKPVD